MHIPLNSFIYVLTAIFISSTSATHMDFISLNALMTSESPSLAKASTINGVMAFFAKADTKCASAPISYLTLSWHTCYGPLPDSQFKVVSVDPDKKIYVFGSYPCSQSAGSIIQSLNNSTCYTAVSGYSNITTAVMLPPGSVDTTVPRNATTPSSPTRSPPSAPSANASNSSNMTSTTLTTTTSPPAYSPPLL